MMFKIFLLLLALSTVMFSTADMNSYVKRTGAKFIKDTAAKDGMIELKSGMVIEVIKSSTNPDAKSPRQQDPCEVTYSGTLKDGTPFDAGTTSFAPNQVIMGWTEAMQLMVEGDKWRLYIPYHLAYGERGSPPKIPPFSPLVFEIEILKVKSGGKPKFEAEGMLNERIKPKENAAEL